MPDHRNLVLILEDNPNRLALMQTALKDLPRPFEIRHWDNVRQMQVDAARCLDQACLISLDFDLTGSSVRNPGDGLDAVSLLLRQKPVCPVVIHTSLSRTGLQMAEALRKGGWTVEQVMLNRREAVSDWREAVEQLTNFP